MRRASRLDSLESVNSSLLYRLFNPQVPVIVCARVGASVAAMPANSCVSISDSPSMVALAIRVGSKTNAILSRSRRFSINWLNYTKEKEKDPILRLSLPQKNPGPDKLGALGIPYELVAGTPVLAQAQAFTLSYVTKKLRTGDHDLFIAKTLLVKASSDFTKDKYWRFKKYKPALYLGSIRKNPMMTISPRKIKH